jgi:hypothetical protein
MSPLFEVVFLGESTRGDVLKAIALGVGIRF